MNDNAKHGRILADIETDKAIAELESTAERIVLRQMMSAGRTAWTGNVFAYVGQPGDRVERTSGCGFARAQACRVNGFLEEMMSPYTINEVMFQLSVR
ncbi:MAG: hypothetical protein LAP13_12400 [Acidobacteriia bacterium]|nr:hypothetical protein [Terriglobia bacterium]